MKFGILRAVFLQAVFGIDVFYLYGGVFYSEFRVEAGAKMNYLFYFNNIIFLVFTNKPSMINE
jgi:hypothetical protein